MLQNAAEIAEAWCGKIDFFCYEKSEVLIIMYRQPPMVEFALQASIVISCLLMLGFLQTGCTRRGGRVVKLLINLMTCKKLAPDIH